MSKPGRYFVRTTKHPLEGELSLLARLRQSTQNRGIQNQGKQNQAIVRELGIAESSVRNRLRDIMTKLHATNRTQVASMLANGPMDASKKHNDRQVRADRHERGCR